MLNYQVRGSGAQPVLMLHGFLGSGRNLGALARGWLAKDDSLSVILPDLTGHGRSPALPEGGDLEVMAEDVLDLMHHLGLPEGTPVIGHSLGGRVALVMRHRDPHQVGLVGLLDIPPGPTTGSNTENVLEIFLRAPEKAESREQMGQFLSERGLSLGLTNWLLMNGQQEEEQFVWRVDRDGLSAFHKRMRESDLWYTLQDSHLQPYAIRGGLSDYVGESDAERFAQLGIDLQTVAGAGHFLHVDKAREVVSLLKAR